MLSSPAAFQACFPRINRFCFMDSWSRFRSVCQCCYIGLYPHQSHFGTGKQSVFFYIFLLRYKIFFLVFVFSFSLQQKIAFSISSRAKILFLCNSPDIINVLLPQIFFKILNYYVIIILYEIAVKKVQVTGVFKNEQ